MKKIDFPIVEIFWEDHYSIGDDWFELGHKHDICILSAIGYLVSEDSKYYYVACTYDPDSRMYSAGTAVLKNCVVDFHIYSTPDPAVDKTPRKSDNDDNPKRSRKPASKGAPRSKQ